MRRTSSPPAPGNGYARPTEGPTWEELERLVGVLEALQKRKVLDLARRLRPDLLPEDIASPHDVPELVDAAWQYEDGVLAGIQGVMAALRAARREREASP
jgi:hypothetical protein